MTFRPLNGTYPGDYWTAKTTYINEKILKDRNYPHSNKAFLLFGVGLLNTFTNYAHHTYHLPQGVHIKWISFIISMLEFIILFFVIGDIVNKLNKKDLRYSLLNKILNSCKFWTAFNIFLALLISFPPLNTLIHGTHVVLAHAMGCMIGIDTLALLGALFWFSTSNETKLKKVCSIRIKVALYFINIGLFLLVLYLTVYGSILGVFRYMSWDLDETYFIDFLPYAFVICGTSLAIGLLTISHFLWKRFHNQNNCSI